MHLRVGMLAYSISYDCLWIQSSARPNRWSRWRRPAYALQLRSLSCNTPLLGKKRGSCLNRRQTHRQAERQTEPDWPNTQTAWRWVRTEVWVKISNNTKQDCCNATRFERKRVFKVKTRWCLDTSKTTCLSFIPMSLRSACPSLSAGISSDVIIYCCYLFIKEHSEVAATKSQWYLSYWSSLVSRMFSVDS